ncbi:hypothetical protein JNUCC64_22295 [Streptomyces sp. JNUCC 64]
MPRPTAAQIAYGTATVVCSTLAMLLLSRTTSGIAVTVIAIAALGLGLLVAVTLPLSASRTGAAPVLARAADPTDRSRVPGRSAGRTTPPAAPTAPGDTGTDAVTVSSASSAPSARAGAVRRDVTATAAASPPERTTGPS